MAKRFVVIDDDEPESGDPGTLDFELGPVYDEDEVPPDPEWSYSGDPSTSDLDQVRFLIGDTDGTHPLLNDNEINAALADFSNQYLAASKCAQAIGAMYSRKVSRSIGKMRQDLSELQRHFFDLARELRDETDRQSSPVVYFGGAESSSIFSKGMMNNS